MQPNQDTPVTGTDSPTRPRRARPRQPRIGFRPSPGHHATASATETELGAGRRHPRGRIGARRAEPSQARLETGGRKAGAGTGRVTHPAARRKGRAGDAHLGADDDVLDAVPGGGGGVVGHLVAPAPPLLLLLGEGARV